MPYDLFGLCILQYTVGKGCLRPISNATKSKAINDRFHLFEDVSLDEIVWKETPAADLKHDKNVKSVIVRGF